MDQKTARKAWIEWARKQLVGPPEHMETALTAALGNDRRWQIAVRGCGSGASRGKRMGPLGNPTKEAAMRNFRWGYLIALL